MGKKIIGDKPTNKSDKYVSMMKDNAKDASKKVKIKKDD